MALLAAVVVLSSVVAGLVLSRQGVDDEQPREASIFTPAPDLLPLEKTRQVTLLLQVRNAVGEATGSMLLGVGGDTGFVAELLLPRSLLLPTVPPTRLEDAGKPNSATRAQESLETLLGVQVDATLDLERLAWEGLLDATGVPVSAIQSEQGTSFPMLLDPMLRALPADDELVGQLLTSLGSMAPTTVPNDDLARLLSLLRTSMLAQEAHRATLPVVYLRAGADRAAVADQPDAEATVAELFPQARLQPGHRGQTRVVLERSGATLGTATSARLTLVAAGFGVVSAGEPAAATPGTTVYVPGGSDAALASGRSVAAALGLEPSAVAVDASPSAVVDVRVALGSDFRPV